MKLAFFYDQSEIVRASVGSVWEAILFGLILSVLILYFFLKNWGTTLVATLVIPVTVLVTLLAMKIAGLTFNLMTLGGIAAAIGLVIDDAIVVVEAIHTKRTAGKPRLEAIRTGIGEILRPLVGSTLTPVVVFIPLAFLEGITGVFFRALALTMVVALLTSLALAVTLTPSLAAWLLRSREDEPVGRHEEHGGPLLQRVIGVYEKAVRAALKRPRADRSPSAPASSSWRSSFTPKLESEFLPPMDEGGFRHRLLHASRDEPGGDPPPAAAGGEDPADGPGARQLFAPHRGEAGPVHRRAEHRRFSCQAEKQTAAGKPRTSSRNCGGASTPSCRA